MMNVRTRVGALGLSLAGCLLMAAMSAAAPRPGLFHALNEPRPNGAALLARYTSLTPDASNFTAPLTPAALQTAYGLSGLTLNNDGTTPLDGTGQTVAVLDLSGYDFQDLFSFEQKNGQSIYSPTSMTVDSGNAFPGTSKEVLADIEYIHALAPGAMILDYAAPDSSVGILDALNKIAADNKAAVVVICFGADEKYLTGKFLAAENRAFQQMAAQHMTVVVAAGDLGAYDTGVVTDGPTVLDPAAQPYVLAVGGTTLNLNADGSYLSESAWNTDGTPQGGAGGGGISRHWRLPAWQSGLSASNPEVSTAHRNIPDVSLDADPAPGYDLGYEEGVSIGGSNPPEATYGGTSCAAPIWAAFFALVDQQRAANGLGAIGFVNPVLYQLASGPNYTTLFHDIADDSTNLLYHAVPGYDLATGLGSLTGAPLLAQLATASSVTVKTPSPALADVPVTHIKDLGPELPASGKPKSRAITVTGINDQLLLVGSANVGGNIHAVGYDKALVDLGTLGGLNSYGTATTYGQLSYSGKSLNVVGGADTAAGVEDAFFWQRDATDGVASNPEMLDLGTGGGVSAVAYGLDESLVTQADTLAAHPNVVGDAVQSSGATHAVVWANDGTVIDLAGPGMTTLGGPNSHARAVFDAYYGVVVFGYADTASGQVHAFSDLPQALANGGNGSNAMTDYGTLGGPNSHIAAVQIPNPLNPKAVVAIVVGDADTAPGVTHAAQWNESGSDTAPTDLGTLGGTNSHALAVALSGYIVGTSDVSDGTQHAFIANVTADANGTPVAAMTDLNAFLPANSGWVLTSATGIWTQSEIVADASGQQTLIGEIVGQGLHNGQVRAFELDTQISLGIGRQSGGIGFGK